jgi:sporulation protein YlmC with PRC-barrel domain
MAAREPRLGRSFSGSRRRYADFWRGLTDRKGHFMRLDTLRKRAVVDPESGTRLGTVTDYWIDANAGRVAALIIRPIDADLSERVAADRVARVGRDAVMLSPPRAPGQGTPVTPRRLEWLDRRHIRGLVVYTDTGERLGRINGADVDQRTLAIQNYDLMRPFWRRLFSGRQRIPAGSVAWCGRDVIVVRTDETIKLRPKGQEDGLYAAAFGDLTAPEPPATPGRERANSA